MIPETLFYLLVSLFSGAVATVTASMLSFAIQEGMLLEWYGKLLHKIPPTFGKPLGLCPYCFAPHAAWIPMGILLAFTTSLGFWSIALYCYTAIVVSYVLLVWNYDKLIMRFQDAKSNFKNFYDIFFHGWRVGDFPEADKEYILSLMENMTDEERAQLIKGFKSFVINEKVQINDYTDRSTARDGDNKSFNSVGAQVDAEAFARATEDAKQRVEDYKKRGEAKIAGCSTCGSGKR